MLATLLKKRKFEAWSRLLFYAGVAVSVVCAFGAVEEIAVGESLLILPSKVFTDFAAVAVFILGTIARAATEIFSSKR